VTNIFSLLLFNVEPVTISQVELKEKFSKGIKGLLNNTIEAEEINFSIFSLFSKDGSLQDELSKILIDNQEELFPGKLVIEDREVSPTIANWLKDFIKANGSEFFDELVLAQYLSSGANTKNLKNEEKNLLRKLLKLYRNLNFFPESMDDEAVADWQIIPVTYEESRDVLDDNKIIKKIKTATVEINPLDELQVELTKYNSGSLEHKAVTQEIVRLNKKSKK